MPKKKIVTEKVSINSDSEKNVVNEEATDKENNLFTPEGELVIDVFETNAEFVVLSAIAGAQIKDLDISVEKDMMVIKGHRVDPHNNPEKKYFYQECYWGPFSRKIVLPENVDTQLASAEMDKGILTVKIPKKDGNEGKSGIKLS